MGERHLFVRFEKCNIHCGYCDELDKGGSEFAVQEAAQAIQAVERENGPHACVSLTGGEPLFYCSFLRDLCPELKRSGFKLYLETNGILWQALSDIVEWCDVIAMDMKPASVTGEKNFFNEHGKFLETCGHAETFVKIIVSRQIDVDELLILCGIVKEKRPETPVVLQPITKPEGEGHEDRELMALLWQLQRLAGAVLPDVRVLPRLHRILNIR